jgi:uncharacterized lipoprotein YddW (UPF0748 family)
MKSRLLLSLILISLGLGGCKAVERQAAPQEPTEIRAIWVTRFDYKTPDDVRAIIRNCADLNFNVILFQVRGNGTVFYKSEIEPWAWELTGEDASATGQDPGWDPLALAVEEAHRRGVELHAYMNVFPAWRSQDFPPARAHQLWTAHPDWFMVDAAGNKMVPRDHRFGPHPDWYAFISPGIPAVQDYLASVFEEVARNYDVDGIHFDYIRYPAEIHEVAAGSEARERRLGNWSYDPISLGRFMQETGIERPDDDPAAWRRWRGEQVTATLRKIHARCLAVHPELIFTAAVAADPEHGRDDLMQPSLVWLDEGLLEACTTMNYTSDNDRFRNLTEKFLGLKGERGLLVPGMSFGGNAETVLQQIGITRELPTAGFAGFAYSSLFNRQEGHARRPKADALAAGPLAEPARVVW